MVLGKAVGAFEGIVLKIVGIPEPSPDPVKSDVSFTLGVSVDTSI